MGSPQKDTYGIGMGNAYENTRPTEVCNDM